MLSIPFARTCESLPSTISRCLFRNQDGILYCVGFWIMVTIRSSSSDVISPALFLVRFKPFQQALAYRLLKSTSAFLQTKLEYRRPTPLIFVKAYMIFCLPSTLVLRRRRINWTAHELESCSRPSIICRKRTVRFLAGDERCDRISHGRSRSVRQRIG